MRRPNGRFTTPQRYFLERMVPVFLMVGTVACSATVKYGAERNMVQAEEPVIVAPSSTPTSTPTPKLLTQKEIIIQKITEAFGEDAPDAFNVLYCENRGLNPNATNHNRNGSIDRGLFQINSVHGGDELYNIDTNIKKAKQIFNQRGWSAWACSERVGVRPFWK